MDYNTTRKKLILPEYGRNVQKMVEYACSIEDREERTRVSQAIISIMGNLNPSLRDQGDVKHKLWDHLAIISDFSLEIDSPYELPTREKFSERPKKVKHQANRISFMHYGRIIEALVHKASEMPDGEERDRLVKLIANHMKKSYLTWNKNMVADEVIFSDLEKLSGGRLKIKEDLKLTETKEILTKSRKKPPPRKQDRRFNHKHKPGNE